MANIEIVTKEYWEIIKQYGSEWELRYYHLEQLLLGQGINYTYIRQMTETEVKKEAEDTWLMKTEK